ncbi:hypothetical protein PFISCL1PPCAC_8503 [Pristionchus fissidentatus]|uniref:Thaumatin-like protein n=1 Tax=Pristionchus fissidentatus TaxID=1538716 RepID=A0AAV5VBY7_9BILA|nr:hypothetical protein PFISCL1PPCAC_8503 [Pristionchus fissidentatus]
MFATVAVLSVSVIVAAAECGLGEACIEVYNKCQFPIWPGIQGSTLVEGGGFYLAAGQIKTIGVPNGWSDGQIWARTGCDGNFNCDTGFCGNKLKCEGRGGEPPVSLAEFNLTGAGGQDSYHVSMFDGYNLPVLIVVVEGTYRTNGGQYDCKVAGGCLKNLANKYVCPPELRVVKKGMIVGCKSACLAYNTDQYCCRGAHSTSQTCSSADWTRNYHALFKVAKCGLIVTSARHSTWLRPFQVFLDACPNVHSYVNDCHESTLFCRGIEHPSPTYRVQFC